MKKDRGKFLTVMLVLNVLGSLQTLYSGFNINTNILAQVFEPLPGWLSFYAPAVAAVSLVANVGIWMWKKWAVYLLFTGMGINTFILLFILKPLPAGLLPAGPFLLIALLFALASAGLMFWAIYRKWKYFD